MRTSGTITLAGAVAALAVTALAPGAAASATAPGPTPYAAPPGAVAVGRDGVFGAVGPGGSPGIPAAAVLPERPNLVYIVTDDQTYQSLDEAMPYLTSDPHGSWVRFDDAVVNVANCCPSRSSVFTGQLAHHTGVVDNAQCARDLDDTNLLAPWLHASGYTTGLFGKYLNSYPWDRGAAYVPPGWDRWFAENPTASNVLTKQIVVNDQGTSTTYPADNRHHSTDLFSQKASQWVSTAPEPFFLYTATLVPHRPFDRPSRYVGAYDGATVPHPPSFNEADVSDKPAWVQALPLLTSRQEQRMDSDQRKSWESVRAADDLVRSVVETLSARGVLDRSVVVVTSDHALSFGEHRWKEVKQCAYGPCVHVPLMVRYPGTTSRRDPHVVTNVDLGTTLATIGRTTPGRPQDGRSLVPLLTDPAAAWTDEALIQKPRGSGAGGGGDGGGGNGLGATSSGFPVTPYYALRTDRWTYVEYTSGERELYDRRTDPDELVNVYGRQGTAAVTKTLRARLHVLEQ
ncbi:sulfatase family protein [Lapillicoccus jejuensis]|uniref:Arylsulfatase A-like enzyme n=1 Tax=Lapillicoccus jejuensis TaxID=402171 RepID=A0A542E0Y0_9MICO|nr:sulfatase [Lapillicoccus jejuensis]TQJ08982.1 arylsulfatase A-like enzyme [Lapillicoccus jejuensis]